MQVKNKIFYEPRKYNTIECWKDVTEEQWNDSTWQIKNSIWQSVPTPANLLFPDTGTEGSMSEGTRSYGAAYQQYPNRVALFVAENTSCASYCVHCQRAKSLDGQFNKSKYYRN